ncbi:MAG: DUF2769 domain-containing protein [Nitrospinota bacterium]
MPKVDDTPENEAICKKYCGPCPTYPKMEGEFLFCARGGSTNPQEKKSCYCPECDVWIKYKLKGLYFCIEGAES